MKAVVLFPMVCFVLGLILAAFLNRPPSGGEPGLGSVLASKNQPVGRGAEQSRATMPLLSGDKTQKIVLSASQFATYIKRNENIPLMVGLEVNPNILTLLSVDADQTVELQAAIYDTIRAFHAEDLERREIIYDEDGELERVTVSAYPEKGRAMMAELVARINGVVGQDLGAVIVPAFEQSIEEWTANEGQVRREFQVTKTEDGRFAFHVSLDGGNPSTYMGTTATFVPSQYAHIIRIEPVSD